MGDTDRNDFADIIQVLGMVVHQKGEITLTHDEVKDLFFGYVNMSETIEGLVAVVEGLEADAKERAKKRIWRP